MSDYKKLAVEPGAKVKLDERDPDEHGKHSHKKALPEIQKMLEKLERLHYLMYSENKHSLLLVLQGLDTAGKDGVIRHVFTGLNPLGCTAVSFKQPTAEEAVHDFLWRVHPHAPRRGAVVIFNRSHYEDVLAPRVHQSVPRQKLAGRYDLINDFERLLAVQNETTILKFFLHISKDEQLARFEQRLEDSARNWKISESDYTEREYWDDYMEAYELLLQKTSTPYAPWYVIPSNHKWYRNLAISRIVTDAMEGMKMKQPTPLVDIAEIRRKYHRLKEKRNG